MSDITKLIEKKITDNTDFPTVLHDVAIAFKNKGFFIDTNWKDVLVRTFAVTNEKNLEDEDEKDAHEISNSFVDEPSKFNKNGKTSMDIDRIDDMFEDTNDSFEIPETQADPPRDHPNDELDSEGYVAMPDEEIETNDCSQSQIVLHGIEFEKPSANVEDFEGFDDSDNIDLEMSKLQWEDSTKDNDKNKSASVTPDLDFSSNQVSVDDPDRASVTPDLDFPALVSMKPHQDETNNRSTICENEIDLVNGIDKSSTGQTVDDVEAKETKMNEFGPNQESHDVTQLFGKYDLDETQVFYKSNEQNAYDIATQRSEVVRITVPMVEKEIDENDVPKVVVKMADFVENPETSVVEKEVEEDDIPKVVEGKSVENGESEVVAAVPSKNGDVPDEGKEDEKNQSRISLSKDEEKDDGNCNDEADVVTEKSELPKKSRRRNLLIDSSEDEEGVDEAHVDENPVNNSSAEISNDDEFNVATQKFVVRRPASPKLKRLFDLKGCDWSQLCDQANNEQSNIVFKNVFEQCKDLRIVLTNDVSVASASSSSSTINQNVVSVAPVRQSARSRTKVETTEWTDDAETNAKASKRRRGRIPPLTFKVPAESSTASSYNSSKASSYNSSIDSSFSSKSDDASDNIATDVQATQLFVKASSTPKEAKSVVQVVTRTKSGNAKSGTKELRNEAKKPVLKLAATKNESVTYSPKPAHLQEKLSSDVNENISMKSDQSDQSSSVVSNRGRKRKANSDTLSLSGESIAESFSSISSSSVNRSVRNLNFRVMFTKIEPELYNSTLKELNISIASTDNYNVLITNQIYRTSKFMCALASGKPIVSVDWLDALKKKKSMIDPFQHLLKDVDGEKKYKFNLAKTLSAVKKNGGLFRNHSILVTPNTNPSPDILKDIIYSSSGKYLKTSLIPRKNDTVLCISDQQDKKVLAQLKKKYPTLREITVEDFMQGILQYRT